MNFIGGKSITKHEITYEAPDASSCKQYNKQLDSLTQIAPYVFVNTTKTSLNYSWCCREFYNENHKLVLRKLIASFSYQNSKFFSTSVYLNDCEPERLSCVVDRQIIMWDNYVYDNCSLLQGKAVRAQMRGDEIVSTQGQFAVTLTGKLRSNVVTSCFKH